MATKKNTSIGKYEYFRITKVIGYETVDGKKVPVKKQFYGTSKGDAESQYKTFLQKQAEAKYKAEEILSVATFSMRANQYIDNALKVSDKYADNTRKKYENCYRNHIEDTWLDKMIAKDVAAADIQKFYNEADVSQGVLATMQKFMKGFYKWMARNGYAHDVLSAVEIPKKKTNQRKEDIVVWTDEELDAIRSHLNGRRDKLLFLMLSYTGLRISEALGLKYADIYDDAIHVRRQYNSGKMQDLKTGSSKRDIPLHSELKAALEEHKKKYKNSEYIFTTKSGELYNDGNLRREAMRYYKKIKVPQNAFHTFRSTFATNLCKAGVPLEVASKLLGHKSVEVTAKYYTFIEQDQKIDAINRLK